MNSICINGRAVADPVTKEFGNDVSVSEFSIAWNKRKKNPDSTGEPYIDEAHFYDVLVWNNYGKLVASKLKKGDLCSVQGELLQRSWDEADGKKRYKHEINAWKVEGEFQFRAKEEHTATPAPTAPPPVSAQQAPTPPPMDDDIPF